MKKLIILIILSFLINQNIFASLPKAKPNGHVIFIYDRSGSFQHEKKASFALLNKLLRLSKGQRFSSSIKPKRVSIIIIDSKSDLVADRVIFNTKDLNFMKALFAKRLKTRARTIGNGSQISEGFFMSEELVQTSDLKTLLVVHSDLLEGNLQKTFHNVLPTLKNFSKVVVIGAENRRLWKKQIAQNGLNNTSFYHKEELPSLDIREIFQTTFE